MVFTYPKTIVIASEAKQSFLLKIKHLEIAASLALLYALWVSQ
jgi:hypothetical protein